MQNEWLRQQKKKATPGWDAANIDAFIAAGAPNREAFMKSFRQIEEGMGKWFNASFVMFMIGLLVTFVAVSGGRLCPRRKPNEPPRKARSISGRRSAPKVYGAAGPRS